MGQNKSISERKVYSNTILLRGRRKSSNKQPNHTPKTIREGRIGKGQNRQKERNHKDQSKNK